MTKMKNNYVINRNRINSNKKQTTSKKNINSGQNFSDILSKKLEEKSEVKFSKHALQRLNQRNISLSKEEISKISGAISRAKNKGVKEALILMDNKAFVTSTKNNVVITATTNKELKDHVFTNIDGAVII